MLYFPLINTTYPDWFPFLGGEDFIFFRPVFNIADSSITTGIFLVLIFYRKFFAETTEKKKAEIVEETAMPNTD
jgi:signal peptidase II